MNSSSPTSKNNITTSSSSVTTNNIFVERTRVAVARAKLADDLELECSKLRHDLEESHQRERHARDKLQLIIDQFKNQSEQVKTTAQKALSERKRLEEESVNLKEETKRQKQQLDQMKKELDIALTLRREKEQNSPSPSFRRAVRNMANNNNDSASVLSPFSPDQQQQDNVKSPFVKSSPQSSSKKNITVTQQGVDQRGALLDLNNSNHVLLSPPPNVSQIQHSNDNHHHHQTSFAFSTSSPANKKPTSSSSLLDMKRKQRQQKGKSLSSSSSASKEDRLSSSAKLAARIVVALSPQSIHVEPLFATTTRNSSSTKVNNRNNNCNVFRVGQLHRGWWKHSIITLPFSMSEANKNSSKDFTISLLPSEAMRKPPSGTCLDFTSQLQLSTEAALFLSSFEYQHFHQENINTSSLTTNQQQLHNDLWASDAQKSRNYPASTTPFTSLEFLATWVSLRPSQLCAISLVNRNEFECALDSLLLSSPNSNQQQQQASASSTSSAKFIFYLSNQFNRSEMFIVDCSRIGNERLCCCVFVHQHHQNEENSNKNNVVASWLTLREIRQSFAACVAVNLLPSNPTLHQLLSLSQTQTMKSKMNSSALLLLQQRNDSFSTSATNLRLPQPLLTSLQHQHNHYSTTSSSSSSFLLQQLRGASTNTNNNNRSSNFFSTFIDLQTQSIENNLKNQIEIRFPCNLDPMMMKKPTSGSIRDTSTSICRDVYVTIRNINADCGLEIIESWVSHFSVDFFIPDTPVHVPQKQQSANNNSNNSNNTSTLLLRADIASPGQIRWSFAKNNDEVKTNDHDEDEKENKESDAKMQQHQQSSPSPIKRATTTSPVVSPTSRSMRKQPPSSPKSPIRQQKNSKTIPSSSSPTAKKEVVTDQKSSKKDEKKSQEQKQKLISIVFRFRCTDLKTVRKAAMMMNINDEDDGGENDHDVQKSSSLCSAICSLHIPPPPQVLVPIVEGIIIDDKNNNEDVDDKNNFSCVIPDLTALTVHCNNSDQQSGDEEGILDDIFTASSAATTFQINGETMPSSSGSLRLLASKSFINNNSSNNNNNNQFIVFPLEWRFIGSLGGTTTSNNNTFALNSSFKRNRFQQELLNHSFLSPMERRQRTVDRMQQEKQEREKELAAMNSVLNTSRSREQYHYHGQNNNEEGDEEVKMKERAYEVFGIGLAAAESWMSAASSWMTRFNVFKALLLFESCRATETQSLKQAAWIRRTLLTPPKRERFHPHENTQHDNNSVDYSMASTSASSTRILFGTTTATTTHHHNTTSNINNKNENSSSSLLLPSSMIAGSAADRWAQYTLLIRFSDWMSATTDAFAWSFDAVVSSFFEALTENRLAIGATEHAAAKQLMLSSPYRNSLSSNQKPNINNNFADYDEENYSSINNNNSISMNNNNNNTSIARRAIFTSPCAADGGDEFLMQDDYSHFCSWMEECTRARFELLLHYGDAVATEAAHAFAEASIGFQSHVNDLMNSSSMDVFANRVASSIRHNRQSFGKFPDEETAEYEHGVVVASLKMRMSSLEGALKEERRKNKAMRLLQQQKDIEVSQIQQFNDEQQQQISQNQQHRQQQQRQHQQEQQQGTTNLSNNNEQEYSQQHHHHHHQDLQVSTLTDRCSALEMECETLAMRLDAAEKKNLSHVEKSSQLQNKLDQSQSDAKDYFAELHRLREGIDRQVKLALETETRGMQKELHQEKTRSKYLEREVSSRDEIIRDLKSRLEKEQSERMNKYQEMLKEFSSGTSLSPVPLYATSSSSANNNTNTNTNTNENDGGDSSASSKIIKSSSRRSSSVLGDVTNRNLDFSSSTHTNNTNTNNNRKSLSSNNNNNNNNPQDSLERAHNELGKMIREGPSSMTQHHQHKYHDPKEYFATVSTPSMKYRSESNEQRQDQFDREHDEKRREEVKRKLSEFTTRVENDEKVITHHPTAAAGGRSMSTVAAMEDIPTSFLMEQFGGGNREREEKEEPSIQQQHHQSRNFFSDVDSTNNNPLPTRKATEKLMTTAKEDNNDKDMQHRFQHETYSAATPPPSSTTSTRTGVGGGVYSRLYDHQQKNKKSSTSAASSPAPSSTAISSSTNVSGSNARPRKVVSARPKRF